MTDMTVKELFHAMGSRVTSDQHSLAASQQQKNYWEKIFVESQMAQKQQSDCEEQNRQDICRDSEKQSSQPGSDWLDVTLDNNGTDSDKNLTAARSDDFVVTRPVVPIRPAAGNLVNNREINVNANVSAAGNDAVVAAPWLNQHVPLNESGVVKSGGNLVNNVNYYSRSARIGKVGLHLYQTEKGEMKIWLRDGSLNKHQGVAIIRELKKVFAGIGVVLADFTLNGELLFKDNHEIESLNEGEVTI